MGNPQEKSIPEIVRQALEHFVTAYNMQEKYLEKDYPWKGILVAAAFSIHFMYHKSKGRSMFQLVFGHAIILPIKYIENWKLLHQKNKDKINYATN